MNNQFYQSSYPQQQSVQFVPHQHLLDEMLNCLNHILLRSESMKRESEPTLTDDQIRTARDKQQQFVELAREQWLQSCRKYGKDPRHD